MYLTQGLHRSLQLDPDRTATVFGAREQTFGQLADRVSRLAGALVELGVDSDDRVAILARNSDRYIEYLLATCWADGILNTVNIGWSAGEMADSFLDCQTRILFVDDEFLPLVNELRQRCTELEHVVFIGEGTTPVGLLDYEDLIAGHEPVPDARRGGDVIAALFYTGGTTGRSKGVMLTHTSLLTSAYGCMSTCTFATPGGKFLHSAPMFHLADLAGWVAHSVLGNTQVVIPRFDPDDVIDAVETHGVTDLLLVATMIPMVFDHPRATDADFSSLRRIIYGASPISESVLERTMARVPDLDFIHTYGMTELSPVATILRPDEHQTGTPRLRSVGRSTHHSELRIVDEEDRDVPAGTVGEIVVRGGHVMAGYWNRPEETAEALRGGWMHTGDGAYMDSDGYVFLVDRIKDMIKTGGENVYSTEVENVIHKHPAVRACAVIGLPDDRWGERVHAVVVTAPDREVTADELREFAKSHIGGFKAPKSVSFADELPLSAAGKVLKRSLREEHAVSARSTDS